MKQQKIVVEIDRKVALAAGSAKWGEYELDFEPMLELLATEERAELADYLNDQGKLSPPKWSGYYSVALVLPSADLSPQAIVNALRQHIAARKERWSQEKAKQEAEERQEQDRRAANTQIALAWVREHDPKTCFNDYFLPDSGGLRPEISRGLDNPEVEEARKLAKHHRELDQARLKAERKAAQISREEKLRKWAASNPMWKGAPVLKSNVVRAATEEREIAGEVFDAVFDAVYAETNKILAENTYKNKARTFESTVRIIEERTDVPSEFAYAVFDLLKSQISSITPASGLPDLALESIKIVRGDITPTLQTSKIRTFVRIEFASDLLGRGLLLDVMADESAQDPDTDTDTDSEEDEY